MARGLFIFEKLRFAVVKDKIAAFQIDNEDEKLLTIYLVNGKDISLTHATEKDCKDVYNQLIKNFNT